MTDHSAGGSGDRMNRFVKGELGADEARALAQESLDDPELFEQLTYTAVSANALPHAAGLGRPKVRQFPRRLPLLITGAIAAAALGFYFTRPDSPQPGRSSLTVAVSHLRPALPGSANPGQPLLLADDLERSPAPDSQVFRGPESDIPTPRTAGTVVAIEDGLATIDLGSIDGLESGSEVSVVGESHAAGHLVVTTVFRTRARCRIPAGIEPKVHQQVRVPDAAHIRALLDQVGAVSARGDSERARKIAEQTVAWADKAGVAPIERAVAQRKLASLEAQAGMPDLAEKHEKAAADDFTAAGSRKEACAALNNLAALHVLRGDYDGAASLLNQAKSLSTDAAGIEYARTLNNLAVVEEVRGDKRAAEALYRDALTATPNAKDSDRRAIETNLTRITSTAKP